MTIVLIIHGDPSPKVWSKFCVFCASCSRFQNFTCQRAHMQRDTNAGTQVVHNLWYGDICPRKSSRAWVRVMSILEFWPHWPSTRCTKFNSLHTGWAAVL